MGVANSNHSPLNLHRNPEPNLHPTLTPTTANSHQGWPKLANALFHTAADGGVVVSMWAPAAASLPGGGTVDVETSYPFGDTATVTVRAPRLTLTLASSSEHPDPHQPTPAFTLVPSR